MKFTAQFNFDKRPAASGSHIQAGDSKEYTLNNIPTSYVCDKNELLVINSITILGDKGGLISEITPVIEGIVIRGTRHAVEPGKSLNIGLNIKRADEQHIPTAVIDYPITVVLDVTQYQVIDTKN
jgi:hypothetical protein